MTTDKRRLSGEQTRANIIRYLKNHPNTLGVEISRGVGVSTAVVSHTLNDLKAQGSADYTSGLRGRKFWTWGNVCKRKYVCKTAKTRPISDIHQQIKPAQALI